MLKYALRYTPLLILALLLIPLHLYITGSDQQSKQNPASLPPGASSSTIYSSTLSSIVELSPDDVWAVGGSFASKPAEQGTPGSFIVPSSGIILHYRDNVWSPARVAKPLQLPLFSVSLDSPRDGWAVGQAGTLVHYDGNQWSTAPGPANFNKNLLGVVMLSPSDGWAVGYSGSILHYDGKQWAQEPSPTIVDLRGIAMPSPQEGWAVGDSGTILHYSGGTWRLVTPSPTHSALKSVSMLSPGEGWAVGTQGAILHYRDGIWESVHPASYYRNPATYQAVDFSSVTMSSIRSGWLVGGQHLLTYNSEAWIESGNSINFASELPPGMTPNDLSLSALVLSSGNEGWAVGSITMDGLNAYKEIVNIDVILHYQDGKWNLSFITSQG